MELVRTDRIRQAKRAVSLNNWQRMYEEYLASEQTVQQWCADNNITPKTYYYWLRKLREETLKQEQHEIVPVRDSVEETKAPTVNAGVIRITGRRITAELPQDISAELLTALLKGLSSC